MNKEKARLAGFFFIQSQLKVSDLITLMSQLTHLYTKIETKVTEYLSLLYIIQLKEANRSQKLFAIENRLQKASFIV